MAGYRGNEEVEAGRLKTGKEDGTWLQERSRRTGRAHERRRSRLDLSDCLWLAAGCTDHTPLSAHQRPISFVSAGVARVSYRCVYNLPHGFLVHLPDSTRAAATNALRRRASRSRYSTFVQTDLRRDGIAAYSERAPELTGCSSYDTRELAGASTDATVPCYQSEIYLGRESAASASGMAERRMHRGEEIPR